MGIYRTQWGRSLPSSVASSLKCTCRANRSGLIRIAICKSLRICAYFWAIDGGAGILPMRNSFRPDRI